MLCFERRSSATIARTPQDLTAFLALHPDGVVVREIALDAKPNADEAEPLAGLTRALSLTLDDKRFDFYRRAATTQPR